MIDPGATVAGRYQIVRVIGHGGMGEVYEAVQSPLGRKVALKTIRADLARRPELIARFRREAESAAALGHPNIVQVTDFHDVPGETPFIVMELLEGETLAQLLERDKRIDPQRAAFIAVQLLSGLSAAHRAGIIHRDVKPANVFLQSTIAVRDLVKVLDFGIAKLEEDASNGARPMTRAGEVLGTYAYMAPEQRVSRATVDARTDVYGVGATLFHALSGLRVLEVSAIGTGRTPLAQIAPWVHRDLAAVVESALSERMEDRYASAEEMTVALQPFASAAGPQAATLGSPGAAQPPGGRGLDASAIGRMEAPTGGSSFGSSYGGSSYGASSYGASSFGPAAGAQTGFTTGTAPTAYASTPPEQRSGGGWNMYPSAPPPGASAPPPAAAAPAAPAASHGFSAPAAAALPFGSVRDYGAIPAQGAPGPAAHPHHHSHAPMPYGPGPAYASAPMAAPHAAPKGGVPWWVFAIIAVVVLGMGVPYMISFLAIRNATNPDTIATNVEREVLKAPKQPCPFPEQCTVKREEHGLVYPLCSKRSPKTAEYKIGEMVLAGEDERIALVNGNAGGGKYSIRFLSKQGDETVSEDQIFGRLCRAGTRTDEGQTAP